MIQCTNEVTNFGFDVTCVSKLVLPALPRVIQVVYGEHYTRAVQPLLAIHLPVQHSSSTGLPLMDMQDVRLLVAATEVLQGGPENKEGEEHNLLTNLQDSSIVSTRLHVCSLAGWPMHMQKQGSAAAGCCIGGSPGRPRGKERGGKLACVVVSAQLLMETDRQRCCISTTA